jgi:hypothetical protein
VSAAGSRATFIPVRNADSRDPDSRKKPEKAKTSDTRKWKKQIYAINRSIRSD